MDARTPAISEACTGCPNPHPAGGRPSPQGAGLLDAVLDPVSWGSARVQPFFRGPSHQPPSLKPVSPSWPFLLHSEPGDSTCCARLHCGAGWGGSRGPTALPPPGPTCVSPVLREPPLPHLGTNSPPLSLLLLLRSHHPSDSASSLSDLSHHPRHRPSPAILDWGQVYVAGGICLESSQLGGAGGQGTPLPSSG